ncbi:MAG: NADH-quinone oxidoreductase subunit J [Zoogloeaceae bacterium]|nr:NADH-quinone oxidoreductase subunit J [Zoogloeaceae bacterium]
MHGMTLLFYGFSAILLYAACRVVSARNPVHAVLHLILAFFTAACLWMLLEAEFLALALIMVYIGAVMVLFLFVVMMLDIDLARLRQSFWRYFPLGAGVGILVALEMGLTLGSRFFREQSLAALPSRAAEASNTRELGALLVTDYAYPFELAALVLLAAIVGAVALTYRKSFLRRSPDPERQVRVSAADRLRLVSMPAEKEEDGVC